MEVTVTTVVIILGGSFGAMFAAMVSVMFFSIRTQHRDNLDTRQLIADTNLETRQEATRQIDRLGDRLSSELAEHKRIMEKNHDELRDELQGEFAEHKRIVEKNHDELRGEFAEHKRIVEKNHNKVVESLSDARERLARIEGHLRIPPPPPPQTPDPADQDDRDGEANSV